MDLSQAVWLKSSFSGGNQQQCVEVAANLPGIVALRDSKNVDAPAHVVSPATFRAFVSGVKSDRFAY